MLRYVHWQIYFRLYSFSGMLLCGIHDEYLSELIHERPSLIFCGEPDRYKSVILRILNSAVASEGAAVLSNISISSALLQRMMNVIGMPVCLHDPNIETLDRFLTVSFERLATSNTRGTSMPLSGGIASMNPGMLRQAFGLVGKKSGTHQRSCNKTRAIVCYIKTKASVANDVSQQSNIWKETWPLLTTLIAMPDKSILCERKKVFSSAIVKDLARIGRDSNAHRLFEHLGWAFALTMEV